MNETITIWKGEIKTDEAVKSIGDLKENIKALKGNLETLEVGTSEYSDTLNELKVNQNALKDAMYATSASMDDVTKSATGMSESYNSLTHRMASLKEEFRSTTDAVKRADLGAEINKINDKLKDMDAMQGNFQRNVGNYTESIKKAFSEMPEYAEPLKKAFEGVDKSMGVLSKNPIIGIAMLLLPVVQKMATALKDNETAMEAVQKVGKSLEPIFTFLSGVIQKLAEWIDVVVTKVSEVVASNGVIQKVINGVMGVGNAILQFVITPFKAVISAIEVFKEEGISGFKDAAKAFKEEFKKGVSFKQNFQAGQAVGEAITKGVKSKQNDVTEAVAETVSKSVQEGVKEAVDTFTLDDLMKGLDAYDKVAKERLARIKQDNADIERMVAETSAEVNAEVDQMFKEMWEKEEEDARRSQELADNKIRTMFSVASATSAILGSIADMYESDEEASEQNANKIKALRIASATIDTISGAVGAYMQSVATIPPPFGAITGAIQAAAVTAAGMAQIAQIKNQKVGSDSTSGTTSTARISSIQTAPGVTTNVTNVRSLTSASEEERLNQMASKQKVYIVASEIQESQESIKTQIAESEF